MQKFLEDPSAKNEKKLITELKEAEFLAPILLLSPLAKPDGGAIYEEEGSNIKFVLLEDEDTNESYFPAFTSKDELKKWRNDDEQESIKLKLSEYLAMLEDKKGKIQGVVINAFDENLILNQKVLQSIL
ncbi:MAG: SseB family protein [Campylobacter sp.]|nr:SseB family protein [Campylobacter sp.]